jgi:hypothetical protein
MASPRSKKPVCCGRFRNFIRRTNSQKNFDFPRHRFSSGAIEHLAEAGDDVARAQPAEATSLRLAAFRGADLIFEFAAAPIDFISHRLIGAKLCAQLDPQARSAERRAFTGRVRTGASILFAADDASMAVRTAGLARRHTGGWPGQGQALEGFAGLQFSRGEVSLAAQYRRA